MTQDITDFKPGDDVWFFEFPEDGCGGFDVSQVALCVNRNMSAMNLTDGYVIYSYKSKTEAVNALIEQVLKQASEYE